MHTQKVAPTIVHDKFNNPQAQRIVAVVIYQTPTLLKIMIFISIRLENENWLH